MSSVATELKHTASNLPHGLLEAQAGNLLLQGKIFLLDLPHVLKF